MAMQICSSSSMIYLSWFGFVSKFKLAMLTLITFAIISLGVLYKYVHDAELALNAIIANTPIPTQPAELTLTDHVSDYIHAKNPSLSPVVTEQLADSVVQESKKQNLPVKLLLGVIAIESSFEQYAISKTGALGFMQIIVKWHVDKIKKTETKDIYSPAVNIAVGAKTLRDCIDLHKSVEMGLLCYSGSQHDSTKEYSKKVLRTTQLISLG